MKRPLLKDAAGWLSRDKYAFETMFRLLSHARELLRLNVEAKAAAQTDATHGERLFRTTFLRDFSNGAVWMLRVERGGWEMSAGRGGQRPSPHCRRQSRTRWRSTMSAWSLRWRSGTPGRIFVGDRLGRRKRDLSGPGLAKPDWSKAGNRCGGRRLSHSSPPAKSTAFVDAGRCLAAGRGGESRPSEEGHSAATPFGAPRRMRIAVRLISSGPNAPRWAKPSMMLARRVLASAAARSSAPLVPSTAAQASSNKDPELRAL